MKNKPNEAKDLKQDPQAKMTQTNKEDPKSSQKTQDQKSKDNKKTTENQNKDASGNAKDQKEEEQKWYEGPNKEVVIYYLIAVFFLEIIIGAAAFFYGVANAEPLVPGGPRMAKFPWVGWLIAASLAPVGLLLLFHLSGWFFTRSTKVLAGGTLGSNGEPIPKNVEQFYSVVSNAPVVVVLLGLLALGGCLYFLDTALGTLRPYIPWILGSATLFLVIAYVTRLFFLAKHRRMEREYEYRMRIFEKTGMIITDKNMIPLSAADIARAQNALLQNLQYGLPQSDGDVPKLPPSNPKPAANPKEPTKPTDSAEQSMVDKTAKLKNKAKPKNPLPTEDEIVDIEYHEKKDQN
ncbi:MAG: DUF2909 domain-containing protein [Desulfovibrionaceae bacterium]|nr:DUF2909 domain-containing protein [Desulfovibrionaceae bacterium]